jgi:hypothetical protein
MVLARRRANTRVGESAPRSPAGDESRSRDASQQRRSRPPRAAASPVCLGVNGVGGHGEAIVELGVPGDLDGERRGGLIGLSESSSRLRASSSIPMRSRSPPATVIHPRLFRSTDRTRSVDGVDASARRPAARVLRGGITGLPLAPPSPRSSTAWSADRRRRPGRADRAPLDTSAAPRREPVGQGPIARLPATIALASPGAGWR